MQPEGEKWGKRRKGQKGKWIKMLENIQ